MTDLFITPIDEIKCTRLISYRNLDGSLISEHNTDIVCFKCTNCDKLCNNKEVAEYHILSEHRPIGFVQNDVMKCGMICHEWKCDICQWHMRNYTSIVEHIKLHSLFIMHVKPLTWKCKQCCATGKCECYSGLIDDTEQHTMTHS